MTDIDRLDQALESAPGTEYNEDVFLYFLAVERARAERGHRPLRLLVVSWEPFAGKPADIPPLVAARLFQGLRRALRETDITGWYSQQRVAGAILVAPADASAPDMSAVVERRVGDELRIGLPPTVARSLRIRVIGLGPQHFINP